MSQQILFVDDEPRILQALERQLKTKFSMRTASGPEEALRTIRQDGPFAVVVSDFRMPVMNGIQFLTEVRKACADTVRVMLTGQADLDMAISAVNEGSIFRFLTKPCPQNALTGTLTAALEQYRLVTAERELLEKTLRGSIQVMTEMLSLLSPGAFSRSCVVRRYVTHLGAVLDLKNAWEFELAALLSQLGCITVPQFVLDKVATHESLSPDEEEVYGAHTAVTEHLLEHIPRLGSVARVIRNQGDPPTPGECAPALFALGPPELAGTAILRAATEFDRHTSSGKTSGEALERMRQSRVYHADILKALESVEVGTIERVVRVLRVRDLSNMMVANQDISTSKGLLLLPAGQELTVPMILRLRAFARTVGVVEPISMLVSAHEA